MSARDLRFLPPFIAIAPEHLTAAAERILAGKYSFFDLEDCELGDPPQWNRDPLTQRTAGDRRATAIDYRDEREVGNIKYLWEPNRHLHLPVLAQAHALTGDARYALAIQAQIDSWIEQCPEGWGPNWISPLELGIRLINWSITWQLLGGLRAKLFATPEGAAFRDRWLDSIFRQTRMIAGNLSRFSSANNHLIGEAAGVYVAASTWPLWPQMTEWGERCRDDPRRGMPPAERARWRQSRTGVRLPDLRARFPAARGPRGARAGRGFLACLLAAHRGDDRLPRVHDRRGRPAAHDRRRRRWPRGQARPEPGFSAHASLIATGAVLFGRADLAAKAGALDGKTATLLGVEAVRRLAQLKQRGRAGFRPRLQFSESGLLPAGHRLRHARRSAPAGRRRTARISQHRRAWPRGCAVVRAEHRRPRNPGRPGHLRVSHRSGLAALLPQHAGAQHRGHRRARTSRCRPAISCGPTMRRRAASSSRPAPNGSASSASTMAISGSRIRWCTGARSSSTRGGR